MEAPERGVGYRQLFRALMGRFQQPAADTTRVVLRLAPAQIVDLHALLEGYDDLAVLRTLDAAAGTVEILVSPGGEGEFELLRQALCREGLPTTRIEEEV